MEYEELNYFIKLTREGITGNVLKSRLQTFAINKTLTKFDGIGIIEAFTGFGKGHLCKDLFIRYRKKFTDNIIVIVPSDNLYEDFVKIGKELELINYYVYVLKGYTMSENPDIVRNCGLLIVDEVHRVCGEMSEYFKNAIPLTTYKRLIGLSATLSFEHKEFLSQYGIKVSFSISITEGTRLNIVPEYKILNVGVELTTNERIDYVKADKYFKSYFKFFNIGDGYNSFELMMACGVGGEELKKVSRAGYDIEYATSNQWAALIAGYHQGLTYKDIKFKGVMAMKAMRDRETVINKAENKIFFLIDALNIISKNNEIRDSENKSLLYSMSFIHDREQIELLEKYTKSKAIGYYSALAKKLKDSILSNFKLGVFYHLLTFKALDEGYDNKKLSIGFNLNYHSKLLNTVQRLGRVIRRDEENPDKQGIFIFVYCTPFIEWDGEENVEIRPNDFKKLPNLQKGMIDVNYLTKEQCLEMLEKL